MSEVAACTTPLVEVTRLSHRYGTLHALRDVSFSLARGEVLGFLGPNGAGKSTTMQILSGNLAPSDGEVRIDGHDLLTSPRAAKRCLGYLPEHPPVYRDATVDEYLDFCAALHCIPRAQRQSARESAKAKCGIADVGRRLIGNLSRGYQQRVGLAQALIHLPPLIVLDEPTVGLDPIQIREVRGLIRALARDHGVILSTHILSEVQATCDRVQIINKGALVLNDTIEGLSQRMQSRALIARFHRPVEAQRLRALAGVTAVETRDDGRVRLFHAPDQDPTDALLRLSLEHALGLYALEPERASLEEVFVELTRAGAPDAAAA